jgi:hypothetical protein
VNVAEDHHFELPDTIAALPRRPFVFSPSAFAEADALLALPPEELFHRLARDQESEAVLLASRRIIEAFLPVGALAGPDRDALPHDGDGLFAYLVGVRAELARDLDSLGGASAEVSQAVARQRAPLALVAGCWLDMVSQPATQPAIFVNRLVRHQWRLRGRGNALESSHRQRALRLEAHQVTLPAASAPGYLRQAAARPLTGLDACFYLALSRLPANFLPEVVGIHYGFFALGVDDRLLDLPAPLSDDELRTGLTEYLSFAAEDERRRLRAALRLVISLEREQVAMLEQLAAWHAGRSLDDQVAEIIARHAPMAGEQHGHVRVGGRALADHFADPELDLAAFLRQFRESPLVQATGDRTAAFIQAMKFGGPMFGIFDERESAVFKAWVASVQSGERPDIELSVNRAGDEAAARWGAAMAASAPADVEAGTGDPRDDRELFYRLVNIENFPSVLPLAKERARQLFESAEILFEHGAAGRYTDASWFDYSPEALMARGQAVYWDKLVHPYKPIVDMPDRDLVIFAQTTYTLGSLIDGAWIHRVGNLGHRQRASDEMLYNIYADEMGYGDLHKNHITLVHRVLKSMDIAMPHIRQPEFRLQRDLPDDLYGFSLHQMCMALHPDTFYSEILGYNFAIEMFGSGEFRLHEIQKLRYHGFDDCYEVAHLAIDNFSSGHTRQAADIIVSYLEDVRRTAGEEAVAAAWRRVWRGYASLGWFVEHALLKQIAEREATGDADLAGDDGLTELIL